MRLSGANVHDSRMLDPLLDAIPPIHGKRGRPRHRPGKLHADTHLYEFRAGGAGWGVPDPDGFYDGPMPAKKATLQKVLEDTGARTLQYVYDFGDDWDHSIRIERVSEASPGVTYPRLLKASGACPPEDVGGAPGYEAFLEALADPDHEQHDDMVSWSGASFDPKDARIDRIVERFDQLAKKWSPRPGKPKAPKPTP